MARQSAGLLLFRLRERIPEVLLVHPGGPYWKNKHDGAWSIPKGEFTDEDPLEVARREIAEETGFTPTGPFFPMGEIRQTGGKRVAAWAVQGDFDATRITSNEFSLEWPPRSGTWQTFPEIDRAGWFSLDDAAAKLIPAQRAFLDRLARHLETA